MQNDGSQILLFIQDKNYIDINNSKKDPCAVFGSNNDRLFLFSIRNMVFHCIFPGKRTIIIYIKTRHKYLFSHYNLILRKL